MAKIDQKYHKLLETILSDGYTYEDPNRKGVRRIEIPSYSFYHSFKDGFPAITTKKLYWKGVVGELLWFLRGDTNIKYLVDNGINIWNKDAYNYYLKQFDAKDNPNGLENFIQSIKDNEIKRDLGRIYGAQWRNWTVHNVGPNDSFPIYVDQIVNLIRGLKENPMGTRHIVTAWNPAELDDMALPPCHWSFEILVEPLSIKNRNILYKDNREQKENYTNGNLEHKFGDVKHRYTTKTLNHKKVPKYQFTLKWHQRSVDTFLGLPFNIASYALLAQIIGKMTNMIPKGIIGDLSNVHIYEPHINAVKEQLSRNVDKYKSATVLTETNNEYPWNQNDLDNIINSLKIGSFELRNYKSYPRIPAEMLAYNK